MSVLAGMANGLLMGGVYGLVAAGLSLVFGVAQIVNFSHGALLTVAMFLSFLVSTRLGIHPYIWAGPNALLMFVLGYILQARLISPVVRRENHNPVLPVILLTTGLWMALQNGILFLFGADYRTLSRLAGGSVVLGPVTFGSARLVAFAAACLCILATEVLMRTTFTGRAIRAVAQDRDAARLMGVDDGRVYALTFGLGAALVGLAAALLIPFYYVHPGVGDVFLIRSFIIVVLGGLGTVAGSFVAGLLIGLLEGGLTQVLRSSTTEILIFVVFIVVLLVRPTGLMGRQRE